MPKQKPKHSLRVEDIRKNASPIYLYLEQVLGLKNTAKLSK